MATDEPPPPRRLYLDQKDWIAIARARGPKERSDDRRHAAALLAQRVAAGGLIVPFSQSHVVEIGKLGRPAQREEVATTLLLLSRRHAVAPIQILWIQEADAFLWKRFGAGTDREPEPFGKGLAFALGYTDEDARVPWSASTPESDIAVAEMLAIAEPSRTSPSLHDIERSSRWDAWAKAMTSSGELLLEGRQKGNDQDRFAAMILSMVSDDLIEMALGCDVQQELLEFLAEEGAWAAIREMPSLAVLAELCRVRFPDAAAPWLPTDYHDLRFLSVALAYCDAVCPDRRWADLARRSSYVASRGAMVTTGDHGVLLAVDSLGA